MNEGKKFLELLSVLPDKRENAIHMKELARRLDMNERETRQYVLDARKEGFPVLSNTRDGYWEGCNDEELERYIKQRRNVANTIFTYTRRMKNRRESHSEKE